MDSSAREEYFTRGHSRFISQWVVNLMVQLQIYQYYDQKQPPAMPESQYETPRVSFNVSEMLG